MVLLNGKYILTNRESFNLMFPSYENYERRKMIKLEHGKTYLSNKSEKVKVKKINDNLFEGNNGLEYRLNGKFIYNRYDFNDLIEETDGAIKHFYKKAKSLLTKKIYSLLDLMIIFAIVKFMDFILKGFL